MNAVTSIDVPSADALTGLRKPFPPHQISKLPKETRAQIDARKNDKNLMVFNCQICGGHHHKNAVHLDYVGHAALTDRLLDTDPAWTWEPAALTEDGLPAFDRNGGLWIKLTVNGVTRLGYGAADGKSGGDAVKEIIGDALRNAAMRFGAALDLWHKGDLHAEEDEPRAVDPQRVETQHVATIDDGQRMQLSTLLEKSGADMRKFCEAYGITSLPMLPASKFDNAYKRLSATLRAKAPVSTAQADDDLNDEIPY